jgi:cobalt-zinc-cadmium efflux system outer membrane protein
MLRGFLALHTCVLLAVLCSTQGRAEVLSLDQAMRSAMLQAPEVSIQAQVLEEARGARSRAGALPNPKVDYDWERLRQNGAQGGEWSASVSTPLEVLWTRGPAVRATDSRIEAESHTLDHTRAQVRRDVQAAYVRYHYDQQKRLVYEGVSELFQEASRRGSVRKAEGDISAYEKQRIDLEAMRYERQASQAAVDAAASRRRLLYFLGDREGAFETVLAGPLVVFSEGFEEAVQNGLKKRADLLSARAETRAAEAFVISEGRRGLPPTEMSVGFKRQEDGFEGAIIGLSIGLPLFDRNQGGRKMAAAAANRNRTLLTAIERRVTLEVKNALEQYRATQNQLERLRSGGAPEAMLETVQAAYSEGALSLVEMLDGLSAYQATVSAGLDLEAAHYLSQIELELAMGTSPNITNP